MPIDSATVKKFQNTHDNYNMPHHCFSHIFICTKFLFTPLMASMLASYTNAHWSKKAWHNTKINFEELKCCEICILFYKLV